MSQFNEFEWPAQPVIPQEKPKSDVAEQFPASTALVAELHALCPELFAGAKTIYMAEGGREIKTRVYRLVEQMQEISADEYMALGQAAMRNEVFANRRRR